jgi:GT2 family glycosyltransferase
MSFLGNVAGVALHLARNPSRIPDAVATLRRVGPAAILGMLLQNNTAASIWKVNRRYRRWRRSLPVPAGRPAPAPPAGGAPLISVVTPVYNPSPSHLAACIDSVLAQTEGRWELILVDDGSVPAVREVLSRYGGRDPRVRVLLRATNGGISAATNDGVAEAAGEFIAFLDHDDLLEPDAFARVAAALAAQPTADILYTDEDKIAGTRFEDPFLKPDHSPDLLLSMNYFCHLLVVRRSLVLRVGGLRGEFNGAQDYDLILRAEEHARRVVHLPGVLYHWRKTRHSTASDYGAKEKIVPRTVRALQEAADRRGLSATAEEGIHLGTFRVRRTIRGTPLVSVMIPSLEKPDYLETCVASVRSSTWGNLEIVIVDTGSTSGRMARYYESLAGVATVVTHRSSPFSFSATVNAGRKHCRGDYLVLLNNDTEALDPGWIEAMLEQAQRAEVGAVGAKLLYPNGKIQHAGVLLGIMGVANHASYMIPDAAKQPFPVIHSKDVIREFSAVTAACLMVAAAKYDEVGGFDERLPVNFNDVDFCLQLGKRGYRNIYTPFATLLHHESATLGRSNQGRDMEQLGRDAALMRERWGNLLDNDPCYNPYLSLRTVDYDFARPPRITAPDP